MAPKMAPMPDGKYALLLVLISSHSLFGGYFAATRPEGAGWRFFSWHPMLMMCGEYARWSVERGKSGDGWTGAIDHRLNVLGEVRREGEDDRAYKNTMIGHQDSEINPRSFSTLRPKGSGARRKGGGIDILMINSTPALTLPAAGIPLCDVLRSAHSWYNFGRRFRWLGPHTSPDSFLPCTHTSRPRFFFFPPIPPPPPQACSE
jgi:hypothetical protein